MPLATASIGDVEYAYYLNCQRLCTPHDALQATIRDRLGKALPQPHRPAAPLRLEAKPNGHEGDDESDSESDSETSDIDARLSIRAVSPQRPA